MHRPALARTQRWARCTRRSARHRRTPLKDWLPRHRPSRYGTIQPANWNSGLHRRWRRSQRSLVHRSRSGLRNNHARHRRLRSNRTRRNGSRRRSARGYGGRRCRRGNLCHRRRRRRTCRRCAHGRGWNRRRGYRRRNHRTWNNWSRRSSRHRRCRRCHRRLRYRRRNHWPAHASGWRCCRRSMCHWRHHRTRRHWRRNRFLLLSNGSQHIPRSGNVRQINFGLDFFFAAKPARTGLASRRRTFRRGADVHPHFLRFVLFQRTGVRLLLRHSYRCQRVENGFALNFQLSGKIVDSNLTHPAFRFPVL
jgi:hypothetical protein